MKFKTSLNFLIFLKSYRSIDYLSFQEGLYHLRFQIYIVNQKKQVVKYAVPVKVVDLIKNYPDYFKKPINFDNETDDQHQATSYHSIQTNLNYEKKQQNGLWLPAHILEQTFSYCTKTFQLKKWTDEELIQLNEHCQFILELDELPINQDSKIFLDCELMFYDLMNEQDKSQAKFKCVSVYKSQIHLDNVLSDPLNEYVPVIFDEEHFNIANITLHCIPFDICSINPNNIKQQRNQQNYESQQLMTSCKYLNELDKFYQEYVLKFRQSYEKFSENYSQIVHGYLKEKKKKDIDPLWEFKPHKLPPMIFKKFLAEAQHKQMQIFMKQGKSSVAHLSQLDQQSTISQQSSSFQAIIEEIEQIQILHKQLFEHYVVFLRYGGSYITRQLVKKFNQDVKLKYSEFIQTEVFVKDNFNFTSDRDLIKKHVDKNNMVRKPNQKQFKYQKIIKVEDLRMFPEIKLIPIINEEVYIKQGSQPKPSLYNQQNQFHLFIFVHGFQGNAYDMRLLKNHISVLYPEALLLLSVDNEGKTDEDINSLGKNLADEINNFIFKWSPGSSLGRISFISHSLGGLIARACLPYLQSEHQDKMFSFISLGVPHLGLGLCDKSLINFGMFWLKMWKNSEALKQICMEDKKKSYEETFLYQLSQQPGLSWFRNVVLLNSSQDHYIPYESARIEKMNNKSDKLVQTHNKMVDNIFKNFNGSQLIKLEVNFQSEEKGIDHYIGRKAHIQFLEDQALLRQLLYNFEQIFK